MAEKSPKPISEVKITEKASELDGQIHADSRLVRIALDAMGGDNAPSAIVEGAIKAVEAMDDIEIILVGINKVVEAELSGKLGSKHRIRIAHAEEVIGMDESPSIAFRKKKKSSVHVGLRLVSNGTADAFVSAGNTGATMATASVILRTLQGIDRAAIAVVLPTQTGKTVLLDAGANVSCKAGQLYQFGMMGSMYAKHALEKEIPRVGLLSIGEEDNKGNITTRKASEIFSKSQMNFIGNVEAKLLYKGIADVVVCDGFTGNIALKISESVAEMIGAFLKVMFRKNIVTKFAYLLLKSSLRDFKKKVDHREVGGAPLLGINGAVFISHGSSDAKSIKSAIAAARKFVAENVNEHICKCIEKAVDLSNDEDEEDKQNGLWGQFKKKIGFGT